jgi:putative ABC transport system permease protein
LFLSRALVTGFVGALIGFAVSVLVTWPALPAKQLPWLPVVLLAAPVLAALASWLPALMAAQQDPATILSKE